MCKELGRRDFPSCVEFCQAWRGRSKTVGGEANKHVNSMKSTRSSAGSKPTSLGPVLV